jgi:glycosyltransferase involved in cell wall biosynthesis
MTRKITPLHDLMCLFRLIKIFKKEKPDIVHTHTPKAGILGMMAAKYCGIKIRIHTVAGLPMMVERGWRRRLLRFVEKRTYAAAGHVWPNSYSLMEYITNEKLTNPKKLNVIAKGSTNGIDVNFFNKASLDATLVEKIKTQINYSIQNKYLLYIGRIVVDKGIPELLRVFSELQKTNNALRLILVGECEVELDPLPADTINTIENNPSVIQISWTDEVKYYMHLADYFIFPSHREGFPNVLLQAGAMELPIICSRIAGNVDIVTHYETGLIFDCGNEHDIKNKIRFALDNPEPMRSMVSTLQQIIRTDYRCGNIWKNILAAYKSLLN